MKARSRNWVVLNIKDRELELIGDWNGRDEWLTPDGRSPFSQYAVYKVHSFVLLRVVRLLRYVHNICARSCSLFLEKCIRHCYLYTAHFVYALHCYVITCIIRSFKNRNNCLLFEVRNCRYLIRRLGWNFMRLLTEHREFYCFIVVCRSV